MKGRLAAIAALLLLALPALPARATTARDLRSVLTIDGYDSDWAADEALFGWNAALKSLEEPTDDSKWGVNNDVNQVRVTWDARNLYLAGVGKIWGNNLVLLVDIARGGMATMSGLNSWSRNVSFDTTDAAHGREFTPDLFGATWDGNPTPHLVLHQGGTQVTDLQVGGGQFQAASTFYQDRDGRAMELAIPWSTVFGNDPETRDTIVTVGGRTDTLRWFPPGARRLKICAFVTAGGDNTGGPDSAPDNTRGYVVDGNTAAYVDNYVEVPLDLQDDTGLGHGGPDGIPDWGLSPAAVRSFKYPVPIVGVRFSLSTLEVNRPAFAPDRGEQVQFRFRMDPPLSASDPLAGLRTVDVSANVFDLRGNWVRNLYLSNRRSAFPTVCAGCLSDPALDSWDGRDHAGRIVPPGVYILRTVIEPNLSRQTRSVVVVR